MTNTISILGSTGSIGRQTLDVAEQLGLNVAALTAHSSVELVEEQVRKFRPRLAVMTDEAAARDLVVRLADTETKVLGGTAALEEAAAMPEADTVVTAVVGMVGLKPTLAAIGGKKRIALANKETLVCAGEIVMDAAERSGAEIVPVDSEHSAIFQCLQGCGDRREIKRLILTCSGGPFFGMSRAEAGRMTKKDALKHPNWKMGPKITVDCATLMNKGLEVIEAMHLYRLPLSQVDVVIHRQSIVHSLVEFRDGAVLAQLGTPDMRLPIRYAMTCPERGENPAEPLDLLRCPPLTFTEPDRAVFPCLALAEAAAARGGTACAVLNGANEEAVRLFLLDRIGFYDIFHLTEKAMAALPAVENPTLEEILEADQAAREIVSKEYLA
nr:1-deoxy-D-xylulose-5-phosphate reductoisomerase [uncultured Oscillibacter sp.]